jgi:myo-inositol-1(or 4)-monophosphatase
MPGAKNTTLMDAKKLAVDTAHKVGRMLKERLGNAGRVEFKGEVDIVTEMDKRAEELIVDAISRAFPKDSILTEEGSNVTGVETENKWIIDPIDGTTNYAHGFPVFSVSIALESAGVVVLGVVHNPMLDETFVAERGSGAFLNDKRISVSTVGSLGKGLLATGFPYDIRTSELNNLDHFANFALKAQAIRRAGSAALDLSYVAAGRFDGFWEMKLRAWDVAAAALIIEEAGGTVTDFAGNAFSIYSSECLASNGLIHASMVTVLGTRTASVPKAPSCP